MGANALLKQVLNDERLTRGLDDSEARILVHWLVAQVEHIEEAGEKDVWTKVRALCRRGRSISRFVALWCYANARAAALQLASSERFNWPLPTHAMDASELMQVIVDWELQAARLAS